MIKLSIKDRKILYELSKDARLSASKIARKAGVSKDVAVYTISKLLKGNVVRQLFTLINTEALGFTRHELYIKLKSEEREKELISYLKDHQMFMWARSSLGDWDLLTEFYARDNLEYEKTLREISTKFGSSIKKMNSAVVLREHCFPLKSIGYKEEEHSIEEPSSEKPKLDKEDFKILKQLSSNARISIVEIAKTTKLSPDAVIYRIKNLIKNKMILGYRVAVDEALLGFSKYKILLKLGNINEQTYSKLLTFLKMQKSMQYIKRCVGEWDFSITILAKDTKELRKTILDIKSNLKQALDDYKILILFEEHKNTYFPEGII